MAYNTADFEGLHFCFRKSYNHNFILQAFTFAIPWAFWHFKYGAQILCHIKFFQLLMNNIFTHLQNCEMLEYKGHAHPKNRKENSDECCSTGAGWCCWRLCHPCYEARKFCLLMTLCNMKSVRNFTAINGDVCVIKSIRNNRLHLA